MIRSTAENANLVLTEARLAIQEHRTFLEQMERTREKVDALVQAGLYMAAGYCIQTVCQTGNKDGMIATVRAWAGMGLYGFAILQALGRFRDKSGQL